MRLAITLIITSLLFSIQLAAAVAGPAIGTTAGDPAEAGHLTPQVNDQRERVSIQERLIANMVRKQVRRAARRERRKNGDGGHALVNTGFYLSLAALASVVVGGWIVAPVLALAGGIIGLITRKRYEKGSKYRKRANVAVIIGAVGLVGGFLLWMVAVSFSNWASGFG